MQTEKEIKKLAHEELEYRVKLLENEARWRVQAEAALQEREERLQVILERAPIGFFIIDKSGVFIDANRSIEKLSGQNRKKLIGRNFIETGLLPQDQALKAAELLSAVCAGNPVEAAEFTLKRDDGLRIAVKIHAYPVKLKNNSVILGIVRDITKRKHAEEKLQESEERYRLLFNNAFDVIFSFDKALRLLSVSPSVEKTLGYKPEELIGRPFTELNILTPESLESAISQTAKTFEREPMAPGVFKFIAKDGTHRLGEISINPQFKNGEVVAVTCVGRDITDRVKAEQQAH